MSNPFDAAVATPQQSQAPVTQAPSSNPFDAAVHTQAAANPFNTAAAASNPFDTAATAHEEKLSDTPAPYTNEPWYKAAYDWLNKPLFDLHREGAGGLESGVEDVLSGLTSPLSFGITAVSLGSGAALEALGISSLRLPTAIKVTKGLIQAGFTAQQAEGGVVASGRMLDAVEQGDYDSAKRYMVQAAAGFGGVALAARDIMEHPLVEGKKLGVLKPSDELSSIDRFIGDHEARVQIGNQKAHATTDRLNAKFDAIRDRGLEPDTERGALFMRMEHPDQQAIEGARDIAVASDKISDSVKAMYKRAAELPESHLELVKELKEAAEANWNFAERNGIALGHLDDYITHKWKPAKEGEADNIHAQFKANEALGNFDTRVSFAKQRYYTKALEGLTEGRELATTDPIGLIGWQEAVLNRAASSRDLLKTLRRANVQASDGRPVAILSGIGRTIGDDSSKAILVDGEAMAARQIPRWVIKEMSGEDFLKKIQDGTIISLDGKKEYVWNSAGYKAVDHSAFRAWKYAETSPDGTPVLMEANVMLHPEMHDLITTRLGIDKSALRNNAAMRGLLRASSEAKSSLFSANLMHFVQIAGRSIMSGTNPFRKAIVDIEGTPGLRQLVAHGLQFSSHFEHMNDFITEGMGPQEHSIVSKLPALGKTNQWLHENLWQYVNTQKAQTALHLLDRYKSAYPEWTPSKLYAKVADDVNNRFGLQNWGLLNVNKTWKDAMRLGMLAPDWFVSETRSLLSAFQPGNKIVLQDMARISAFMVLAGRVANMIATGDPHWEQPFGLVVPGKDKRDDRVISMRTLPSDFVHWASDARGAVYNRLNPATSRVIISLLTSRDKNGKPLLPQEQVTEALKGVLPIWMQNIMQRKDIGLDGKEKVLQSAMQIGGLEEYASRTAAEKQAMNYAYSDSGASDPEKLADHVRNMRVMDGLRAGTVSPGQAFRLLPFKTAQALIKESRLSPMESYFKRLTLNQALNVWDLANAKERDDLRRQLWVKRQHWLMAHPTPEDRQEEPEWTKLQRVYPDLHH